MEGVPLVPKNHAEPQHGVPPAAMAQLRPPEPPPPAPAVAAVPSAPDSVPAPSPQPPGPVQAEQYSMGMRPGRIYDLDGTPMAFREWLFEFEHRDIGRGIVAQTHLPNGYYVSTVWLGLDHRFFGAGPPLTYESLVFLAWGSRGVLGGRRYSSEEEASAGHELLVHRWRQKKRRKCA